MYDKARQVSYHGLNALTFNFGYSTLLLLSYRLSVYFKLISVTVKYLKVLIKSEFVITIKESKFEN